MRLAIGIRDIVPNSQVDTEIYVPGVRSTYIYSNTKHPPRQTLGSASPTHRWPPWPWYPMVPLVS